MQNAPSVEYPVGRFFMGPLFALGLITLGAAAGLQAMWLGDFSGWRAVLLGVVCLVCGAWALSATWRVPQRTWLSWNGRDWQWTTPVLQGKQPRQGLLPALSQDSMRALREQDDAQIDMQEEAPGLALQVHLDFQRWLFVSLAQPPSVNPFALAQRKWFWVSQQNFPERWHGLRCAVYSRSD